MLKRNTKPTTTIVVRASEPSGARYLPGQSAARRRRRRASQFSIQAFVGANGGGKSLAAVEMCVLPSWEAGRLVVSNLALYPEKLGYAAELAQPLESSWRNIVRIGRCLEPVPCPPGECPHSFTQGRGCLLLLDEASSALPSRNSGSVPPQLVRVLNQLRKRDVELVWTAPAYARMDVVVRECTQAVTVCTGLIPDDRPRRVVPGERCWLPPEDPGGKLDSAWPPNRLFQWVTYEAMSYDEFTLGKTAQLKPRAKRTYWRTRHDAMHAYKTLEGVDLLDHLTDTGACMDCGLPRKRVLCSCAGAGGPPGGPSGPEAGPAAHVTANGSGHHAVGSTGRGRR